MTITLITIEEARRLQLQHVTPELFNRDLDNFDDSFEAAKAWGLKQPDPFFVGKYDVSGVGQIVIVCKDEATKAALQQEFRKL